MGFLALILCFVELLLLGAMSETQRFTWVLRVEGLAETNQNKTKSEWAQEWADNPDNFSDCSTGTLDMILVLFLWAMCLYYAFFYKHLGLCKMRFCLLFLILIGNILTLCKLITFGRSLSLLAMYPLVITNYYFVNSAKVNKALICFSITAFGEIGTALQALGTKTLYDSFGGHEGMGYILFIGMFILYTVFMFARTWFAMPIMAVDDDYEDEETVHQRCKDDFKEEGLHILAYCIPFYAFIKEPFMKEKAYYKLEDNRRFFLACAVMGATSSVTYYVAYNDMSCGHKKDIVIKDQEALWSMVASICTLGFGMFIDKKKPSSSIPFAATTLCIVGFVGLILSSALKAHPLVYSLMAFLKVGTLGYLKISILLTFAWENVPYLFGMLHMTVLLMAAFMAILVSNPFGIFLQLVLQLMTIGLCLYLGYHFEQKRKLDNEIDFEANATTEYARRTTMMRQSRNVN